MSIDLQQPSMWVESVQVQRGDIWQLGKHRLMCGDSTCTDDVKRLIRDERPVLVCADPPYGMGKEKDGVANDNLYGKRLDAFQMAWWHAARPYLTDNASVYIWGNAEDLWRLWYMGGLRDSERLTMRNEIVWAKGSAGAGGISHKGVEGLRLYPQETERCLFFMLGEQGFNNNADSYWDGWEPIRAYLWEECQKVGLTTGKKYNAALGLATTGGAMFTHHVSPTGSQWTFITQKHYETLQRYAQGQAFKRDYDDLKRDYDTLKRDYDTLKRDFYSLRTYFDNTHENMTDVWCYPRVTGKERYGHPTPKPVAMIERIIKSSTPDDGLVYEPFLGSGTTLISGHRTGRRVYGMEISPEYCTGIIARWQAMTGQQAVKEGEEDE